MVTMLCPVRACGLPLRRDDRRFACGRAHAFDIARRGYVNLLQPQDRRSAQPGDSADAVRARARLRRLGVERAFIDAVAARVPAGAADAVLDVGCGDGAHLAAAVSRTAGQGYGLDISTPAVDAAAKAHPQLHWVVANADRFLPYAAASFTAVLSVTARVNAVEFRRVIRDDGALIVVVPAPEDLIELREVVLGEPLTRDRTARVIALCAPHFTLVRTERLQERERLDATAIGDILAASYRGLRTRQRPRAARLDALDVTLARDVLIFRPAPG